MARKKKKLTKVKKVMTEFQQGALHSGSQQGPLVKKRSQAIAIALSEAGVAAKKKSPRKKKKAKK